MNRTMYQAVLMRKSRHKDTWRDRPESYWLMRLVGFCSDIGLEALHNGWNRKAIDNLLITIASIALNWLEYRKEDKTSEARKQRRFRRWLKRAFEGRTIRPWR